MKVHVASSVGVSTPIDLEVDTMETIRQTTDKVAQVQAVDPNAISLVFNGEVLPPDRTLKNAGIKEGATLKAMPKNPIGGALDGASLSSLSNLTRSRIAVEAQRVLEAKIPLRPASPLEWRGLLPGRGRWRHQTFQFVILLPQNYPARPPVVYFATPPQPPHPNIGPHGAVCLNHLQDAWSPTQNLVTIYEDLQWLLEHPNYHGLPNAARLPDELLRLLNPFRRSL